MKHRKGMQVKEQKRFETFLPLNISNNFHVFTCMQPKQRTSVITCQRYFKVGHWRCILSLFVWVSKSGVGDLFYAKRHLDIYDIIYRPYRIIDLKISLLLIC